MSAQGIALGGLYKSLGSPEGAALIRLHGELVPPFQGSVIFLPIEPRAMPWADIGLPLWGEFNL